MTARRTFFAGGLVVAAIAVGLWCWQTFLRAPRWNVLVVTLSAARADRLGCYGYATAQTPALDALAQRGLLFERAIATAPVTLPSHASLLTGLHPVEHGLVADGTDRLPDEARTLAEVLGEHGYESAAFTAAYALDSRFGLDQGFESYDDDLSGTPRSRDTLYVERPADDVVSDALGWLEQLHSKQFHCWIHLNDPELPYLPHPVDGVDPFAESPYDGEIAFVDRQLSRVIEFLDQRQLAERTLIVIAGDHGAALGEHGEHGSGLLLHGGTLQVPLLIVPPSDGVPAARIAEPVSLVDVLPTVLDILDLPAPPELSGVSLAGATRNQRVPARACLSMTAQPLLDNGWSPLISLTTADWKYVRSTVPELYDLRADPGELENLVAAQPDRVAELAAQLEQFESGLRRSADAEERLADARQRAAAWLADDNSPDGNADAAAVSLPDMKDKLLLIDKNREARQLLDNDQHAAAEPILRELLATDPHFVQAWSNLGQCLVSLRQTEEGIECYQKILQFDPRDFRNLLYLAAAQALSERVEEGIATYNAAIAADPDSPVPVHLLGLLYLSHGDEYQAELLFAQALQLDPSYDPVICSQGDLAIRQGDGVRGVERYQAAIAANPRGVNAMLNLGVYAAQSEEYAAAEQYFRQAVEVAPNDPLARENLARIGLFQGRTRETVEQFESILVDHPNYYSTIVSLGWLRAAYPDDTIRDSQGALDLAHRAIALSGTNSAGALDLLAGAQANAGQFDEALATIDKALGAAQKAEENLVAEMQKRRELYAKRQPFRSTLTEAAAHDHRDH